MDKEVRVNAEPDGQPGDGSPWVAGQSEKTLAQQSDEVILLHLSDYMATSGGGTINGALIEAAQEASNELMEIMALSEDELAERDDLNSPLAQKAKAKAQSAKDLRAAEERAREDLKQQREEERREEARKKWDEAMHEYGGERLTGEQIWQRMNWFAKEENKKKVRDEFIRQGKSEREADETIKKMERRDELMKRQRNGEKLSPEDEIELKKLQKDRDVVDATSIQNTLMKQDTAYMASLKNSNTSVSSQDLMTSQLEILKAQDQVSSVVPSSETKSEKVSLKASSSIEAYAHFQTAPQIKEEFSHVATAIKPSTEILDQKISVSDLTRGEVEVKQPPKISAAKIESTNAAFM